MTIGLAGTKAAGVADTAHKRLGSAKQCLDTALFLSERSELKAGGGGSRSLRILSERSELKAGEGGSRSLRDHFVSFSSILCCITYFWAILAFARRYYCIA